MSSPKLRLLSLLMFASLVCIVFRVGLNGQGAYGTLSNAEISSSSPEISGNYTNVILLGWDGVQRNHLYELLNSGMMPNLDAFIQTGRMVNITVTDHYTDTKAGWTQILTGYRWWKTGVFNNAIWFNTIPKGYTIPERLESIYGSNQIATAFITGKLNQMEIEDGTGTAAVGSPFANYIHEALYANLPSQLDIVSVGDLAEDRPASVVGPLTLQFLDNNANNRFFAFFHFSDPDHTGHKYSENSDEYSQAIETCDYWLGQILGELNSLGIAQKTLIYITADHGFDEGGFSHQNAPYIFLATNDLNVSRNGDEVDVAPTAYYGLGLWNQTFSPALDGYPLQLPLPDAETQHRDAVLSDNVNIATPSINIYNTDPNQKTVTFSASDNNLAAVILVMDGAKIDCPVNWSNNGTVTASGSFVINTTSLSDGSHTVKVLAFDEHGANNGGLGTLPTDGGGPAINTASFYVGTPPTQSLSSIPFSSYPEPTNYATPSPTPSATVSSSAFPTPLSTQTPMPSTQPNKDVVPNFEIYVVGVVVAFACVMGVYWKARRK